MWLIVVGMDIDMLMIEEQGKSTSASQTVSDMADDICSQVNKLDVSRHYLFIEWLLMHSHAVTREKELRENLTTWLGSMSAESVDWEYKLIVGEIRWWRDLDESRLVKIMLECLRSRL